MQVRLRKTRQGKPLNLDDWRMRWTWLPMNPIRRLVSILLIEALRSRADCFHALHDEKQDEVRVEARMPYSEACPPGFVSNGTSDGGSSLPPAVREQPFRPVPAVVTCSGDSHSTQGDKWVWQEFVPFPGELASWCFEFIRSRADFSGTTVESEAVLELRYQRVRRVARVYFAGPRELWISLAE